MDKNKPNVFPTNNESNTNPSIETNQIQQIEQSVFQVSEGEKAAAEEMARRTTEQMEARNKMLANNQELARQEELRLKNLQNLIMNKKPIPPSSRIIKEGQDPQPRPVQDPIKNQYIDEISQPQFNTAFDVIPLPSQGKLYKNKKPSVKVSYLTATDEDILTSPNIMNSGDFLEILINRKLLDTDLRYKDLHVGDRNAIMIWLRATAFGEKYPIIVLDNEGNPFETDFDLSTLKSIHLGAEPDTEGYFDLILPLTQTKIKFKLLTVGDVDMVSDMVKDDESKGLLVNKSNSYTLQKQIVEVDGVRDRQYINEFANNLRPLDSKTLRDYVDKIESGINLDIQVGIPGGGSINTFLPLNRKFFWPNV